MAKKKRRHYIKLNNRIKELFSGLPFDEAVTQLDDEVLMELTMLLGLQLPSSDREEMIRALRRVWSDGEYPVRKQIVDYLLQRKKGIRRSENTGAVVPDKVEHILAMLGDEAHTREEEEALLEHFLPMRSAKVTREKVLNKLAYLRLQRRLEELEKAIDAEIDAENRLNFVHPFKFVLFDKEFTRHLMVRSEPVDLEHLLDLEDEEARKRLEEVKQKAIEIRQVEIDNFLATLEDHPYLTPEEIYDHLRRTPMEGELRHTPIEFGVVERIIRSLDSKLFVILGGDHFILEREKELELFDARIPYKLSLSYERNFIYATIWDGKDLPVLEDLEALNETTLEHFHVAVETLEERMREMSEGLEVDEATLRRFILQFLEPQLLASGKLKVKEKTKRRILYHFGEYLRPLREKKMREELLAKTIRDFKQLFPLARRLKRKITFHAGPTNSGKTYAAMERLKKAETGYYLAPLRLLALEGYEDLRHSGIAASLITGEEEIVDEESTHISSTIEMLNTEVEVECCVIDEIQMIDDRDRGWAWANALIGAPAKEVILTGSENAIEAVQEVCDYLGEELEVIRFERKNPLELMKHPVSTKKIEPNTAIVAFSRKEVLSLKQQLSNRYNVSVVYGNLSPEVRREEARRFREGESQVLVATDAIAMGLNLPIRTILFAKDNKFDGLRRRELTTSEILQIAGRAGRYGLHEHGYVGALDAGTLQTIAARFHAPLPPIRLPFSVMASLEHVLLIGEILETDKLLEILEFFAQNMEFEGPFQAANIDSMMEVAAIVDEYELDLRSRYHLACAPVSISSPYIESVFHRYLGHLEKGEPVPYIPPRELPDFAVSNEELLNAEDRVKEVSLYLWLSFKFREQFPDTEKAREARERLNHFIENSLQKGDFVKRCRRCGRELDFSYRFSICESCYQKGKRGSFRSTRRRHSSHKKETK
ncbi:helicase-related protein [Nitratifractor salsuginis]|uniref:RNA helicase n=1 Tax=Nitratifractor salsuginis (strain DSM 16511 / JCM 12458 / E9I37-1) TaxID=749222 RepID=E6WXS9_NITSE|nr:helicase-related protein [Nitratifractor salsuginis]ADV46336.1 helicase domain protein [Nitratifractor salsuginis DSM 16511]